MPGHLFAYENARYVEDPCWVSISVTKCLSRHNLQHFITELLREDQFVQTSLKDPIKDWMTNHYRENAFCYLLAELKECRQWQEIVTIIV